MPDETKLDQPEADRIQADTRQTVMAEFDTERTALLGQITSLTTERDTARTQITAVTLERDTARMDVARMAGELRAANTSIATLTQSQQDFDSKLRAQLLQLGVRATAVSLPQGDGGQAPRAMTLTEKCLAAKRDQQQQP